MKEIKCPHCEHIFTDDDMNNHLDCDLYALPTMEESDKVLCPCCNEYFFVKGSYIPVYDTFKTEEECELAA